MRLIQFAEYRQQAQLLPLEDMLPVRSLHSREDIYDRSRRLNALQDFQHQLEQFV